MIKILFPKFMILAFTIELYCHKRILFLPDYYNPIKFGHRQRFIFSNESGNFIEILIIYQNQIVISFKSNIKKLVHELYTVDIYFKLKLSYQTQSTSRPDFYFGYLVRIGYSNELLIANDLNSFGYFI